MPPDQQTQEILRKLAEASLAKQGGSQSRIQGGKEIINVDKPVFGQTGENVRFRTNPSQPSIQEPPVDYEALNNPDGNKAPNDNVQKFIDELKKKNENSRKSASEGDLQVSINPAEKEFKTKKSSESLNRAIEHVNTLPDDLEARGRAIDDIMSEDQLGPEDQKKLIEWANEDYKRLTIKR